jgi:AcrR family transcriptional regulator
MMGLAVGHRMTIVNVPYEPFVADALFVMSAYVCVEYCLPRLLSPKDVSSFRDRLCEAAERLFAEEGPGAVTMRQLAVELGCSPMTPYRYFKDKDEILAAVRASAFDRFSEALAEAGEAVTGEGVEAMSHAISRAYLAFALKEPHAYRLMFDSEQPDEGDYPALVRSSARARTILTQYLVDQAGGEEARSGSVAPQELEKLGQAQWAAIHGALMLHLSGKLPTTVQIAALVEDLVERLCRSVLGLQPSLLVGGF